MVDEYPPYNYLNQDGQVVGTSVEILKEIMSRLDPEFSTEDVNLIPWARAYKVLQEQPNAVLFTMVKTEDREKIFKFIGPISSSKISVFTRNPDLKINNIDELAKYRVAVVRDGIGDQLLAKFSNSKVAAMRLLSPEEVVKLLINERVDAIVLEKTIVEFQLGKANEDFESYHEIFTLYDSDTWFAFNKNVDPCLFQRFNAEFLRLANSGKIQKIYQGYLDNL